MKYMNRPKVYDGKILDLGEAIDFCEQYLTNLDTYNDDYICVDDKDEIITDINFAFKPVNVNQKFYLLESAMETYDADEYGRETGEEVDYIGCCFCNRDNHDEDELEEMIENKDYDLCYGMAIYRIDGMLCFGLGNDWGDDSSAILVPIEWNNGAVEVND